MSGLHLRCGRRVGIRITTLGITQVVATLDSQLGPIIVHVVLRETPVEEQLAA